MNFNFRSRGFLFTISIIMFASTLVFFSQMYSLVNSSNESAIVSSARPVSVALLNDDISFGLSRIFDTSFDANYGSQTALLVSGSIYSQPSISSALSSYNSALSSNLFPQLFGAKSVDISRLSDGVAEVFFGSAFEFDYNYSSQIVELFPKNNAAVSRIDLNIQTHNDLNHIAWVNGPVAGSATFSLNYYDDSNYFSISQSFDPNSISKLVLFYNDGNIIIDLGRTRVDVSSALRLSNFSQRKITYAVNSMYSLQNPFPIYWNALLKYSGEGFDTNSRLLIRK